MNIPMKYRVLEAIADSCDIDGIPQHPTYQVIKEAFPKMSTRKMRSIVAKLKEKNLLGCPRETSDGETYMAISPTTHAVLVEEWERVEQRKEAIRERLCFALLGFALGLVSGIIVSLANKGISLLFGS